VRFLPRHLAFVFLLALLAVTAPLGAQTVEAWQRAAIQKHPALAEAGSPLNQRFLALIAEKRKSDPAFFSKTNWPVRAADAAAEALQAEQQAAADKAKADEAARLAAMSPEEQEWDKTKARWVFERLAFGDNEETITAKLNHSKLIASRVAPAMRVAIASRFQWVLGESKYHLDFEMKGDGLAAVVFESSPEKTTNLDGFIHDDWAKLRAAAIEQFGAPSKSTDFPPDAKKLTTGGFTPTDTWDQPTRRLKLGLTEDDGRAHVTLRLTDPAHSPE